jgi:integrase
MPRSSKTGIRGLYRDDDGRYRIDLRYIDSHGVKQRHQEMMPPGVTAGMARKRAQDVLSNALEGKVTRQEAKHPTKLSDAFDVYLKWVQTNRPKSYRDKKSIKAVWIATVGDVPISRLDLALLEVYKFKRLNEQTAPATINKGLKTVLHMCSVASKHKWGWMSRDQAAELRDVELLTEPPGRQRPIQQWELQAIFGAFTRRDSRFARRVVQADLYCGCRLGELLGLTVRNVDLRRKLIDLSHTKQNRNHQIMITQPLAEILKEALAEPVRKCDKVFVNRFGEPYTVSGFSKQFSKIADRAGVPDITYHDLRRHVGTVLANAGERLEVIAKLLGHSTTAPTQRSYAHLVTDSTRGAFNTLASVALALPVDSAGKPQTSKKKATS